MTHATNYVTEFGICPKCLSELEITNGIWRQQARDPILFLSDGATMTVCPACGEEWRWTLTTKTNARSNWRVERIEDAY